MMEVIAKLFQICSPARLGGGDLLVLLQLALLSFHLGYE